MNCLDILAQLSVMINAGVVFFTSKIYRDMFVEGETKTKGSLQTFDLIGFLILVIGIEHLLLIVKIFIE